MSSASGSVLQQQYVKQILRVLKFVSFHQIYMQNQRCLLSKQSLYDPSRAFKSIDSFRHGLISPGELRSFLELRVGNRLSNLLDRQCEEVLGSINKNNLTSGTTYQDFLQMTLPLDIKLRNIALSRYAEEDFHIGVMAKVYEVNQISAKKIADFFWKQVQFNRQLLLRKQHFCQGYGPDLYTFCQKLCKPKQRSFNFLQFIRFTREYETYFNQQQFLSIYRRTKSHAASPLFYDNVKELQIEVQSLSNILLTTIKNLSIRQKLTMVSGLCFKKVQQPSYRGKTSKYRKEQQKIYEQQKKNEKYISEQIQCEKIDKREIRYNFYYPEQQSHPQGSRTQLKRWQRDWGSEVAKMGSQQIDIRYAVFEQKHYYR